MIYQLAALRCWGNTRYVVSVPIKLVGWSWAHTNFFNFWGVHQFIQVDSNLLSIFLYYLGLMVNAWGLLQLLISLCILKLPILYILLIWVHVLFLFWPWFCQEVQYSVFFWFLNKLKLFLKTLCMELLNNLAVFFKCLNWGCLWWNHFLNHLGV